jgi:hypothetical protein
VLKFEEKKSFAKGLIMWLKLANISILQHEIYKLGDHSLFLTVTGTCG